MMRILEHQVSKVPLLLEKIMNPFEKELREELFNTTADLESTEARLEAYQEFAERVCRGDVGNTILLEKMLKALEQKESNDE